MEMQFSLSELLPMKKGDSSPTSPGFAKASPRLVQSSPRIRGAIGGNGSPCSPCSFSSRNPDSPIGESTPSVLFYPTSNYSSTTSDPTMLPSSNNQTDEFVELNHLSPLSKPLISNRCDIFRRLGIQKVCTGTDNKSFSPRTFRLPDGLWADVRDEDELDLSSPVQSRTELIRRLAIGKLLPQESTNTTLMVRNIPNSFSRDRMIEEMRKRGVFLDLDFFYMPGDSRHRRNVGYCFVNLKSPAAAAAFKAAFNNVVFPENGKTCAICEGKVQGQKANIEAYHKSAAEKTEGQYRPCIFDNGVMLPFPHAEREAYEEVSGETPAWVTDEREVTVMLRNIPNMITRDMLKKDFESLGVLQYIDFLYLPVDMRHRRNVGYAFVNIKGGGTEKFYNAYNQRRLDKGMNDKRCQINLASVQGLEANIETYRNSVVMCLSERYQPLLFENGVPLDFPRPSMTRREIRQLTREKNTPPTPKRVYF